MNCAKLIIEKINKHAVSFPMTNEKSTDVSGEHALREDEKDRLGFAEVASRIARSIVDRASKDGLVIGLDGEWGSGKSSLLHLIERSLGQLPSKNRPTIINFRPWLVGDRDALLSTLFSELADKIAHVHLTRGDTAKATKRKAQKAAATVRKFGRVLGRTGELLEPLDAFVPGTGVIGKVVGGVGKALGNEPKAPNLAALKEKINLDLKELDHRFIITVDDVDRLEPKEVIEVLRLVRSVADFPNIIYLLCYDAARVAEAITSGVNVKNGAAYLEKIVQLTVMLPKPEPFELRQWFQEELHEIIGAVPEGVWNRLKTVIDQEGGIQLRTPRSVVRTLDSIRFLWPALREEKIDVADLVWVQLIKDNSPKLYRWVESYVASVASISFGTNTISDEAKAEILKDLIELLPDNRLKNTMYRYMFIDLLPSIQASYDKSKDPVKIFQKIDDNKVNYTVLSRRLSSPDHYRLYFSLIGPRHSITKSEFDSFWAAVDSNPDETAQFILGLHQQRVPGSLRKSDVLFERLRGLEKGLWSSHRARNLLLALGQMMDDAHRLNPTEENFNVDSWDRADRLFPILYARLSDEEREKFNMQFFSECESLGWLTSILRSETFAHGKYGDQAKRPEEWWIPEKEFEQTCQIMINRYRSTSLEKMLKTPRPIHIFFAWRQAGDEDGPQKFLKESVTTDQGVLDVLGMFVVPTVNDRGRYYVIKREDIGHFLDYDAVTQRLFAILKSGLPKFRERATELIAMLPPLSPH